MIPALKEIFADDGLEDLDAMDPLGGVLARDPDEEIDGTKVQRMKSPRLAEVRRGQSIAARNGWRK